MFNIKALERSGGGRNWEKVTDANTLMILCIASMLTCFSAYLRRDRVRIRTRFQRGTNVPREDSHTVFTARTEMCDSCQFALD